MGMLRAMAINTLTKYLDDDQFVSTKTMADKTKPAKNIVHQNAIMGLFGTIITVRIIATKRVD